MFSPRSFEKQKDHYWHLSRAGYMEDANYVDPAMPETPMHWKNPGGEPVLLASSAACRARSRTRRLAARLCGGTCTRRTAGWGG